MEFSIHFGEWNNSGRKREWQGSTCRTDRVIFERLATPRSAPKVTLKSNWRTQPQQPILDKDVTCFWKQRATWESSAGVRDDTKHDGSGTIIQKTGARHFWSGRWCSSQWKRSRHRCILEQRSECSRYSNEWKLVRTRFVFEKTLRRRRWCSAKNPAVPFSKWAMWSSLNWRNHRFHANHAYLTFLKEHLSANAVSL